ncbi:MAG: FlgD immunoglobulin-like domain containing protein [Treponemataceae bacterium]
MKNLKFIFVIFAGIILFSQNLMAKDVVYVSPNADGSQDELVIPLRIKETRYISEWKLQIFDKKGLDANPSVPIKVIGNKDKRDESASSFFKSLVAGESAKSFFKNLGNAFGPKNGVTVPEEIRWDCHLDNGQLVNDGTYFYYFSAKDDNGNEARTKTYTVVIDTGVPVINLVQPSENAKIFGAGSKPVLPIKQSGSKEDLWTATFSNSSGEVVRTYTWENSAPSAIDWDGQNDNGFFVEEGVYTYQISCTNRAGTKSQPAFVSNIIYDAVPRSVSMYIDGSPFSPGTASPKQSLLLDLDIPNTSGMSGWKIFVTNVKSSKKVLRTISGSSSDKLPLKFDGRGDDGNFLLDGEYNITFSAMFNNGQEPKKTLNFEIDTVAPRVQLSCDSDVLSPDGDGNKDIIKFTQTASNESSWTGRIVDNKGKFVKNWTFEGIPPETIEWNGIKDDGTLASDGFYYYELAASDSAGNSSVTRTGGDFELDTSKAEVVLHCSSEAFSPNGDGNNDTIDIVPVIKATSGIEFYYFCIVDKTGNEVWNFSDKGNVKNLFKWDGKNSEGNICSDGQYFAKLQIKSKNGNVTWAQSQNFTVLKLLPVVNSFTADNIIFSPNGKSAKRNVTFSSQTTSEELWKLAIKDSKGNVVREETWKNGIAKNYTWNGTDDQGNIVKDGKYVAELSSQNIAGSKAFAKIENITVDTREVKAYVTTSLDSFSPLVSGKFSSESFTLMANPGDGIEQWQLSILDVAGKVVRSWSTSDQKEMPKTLSWNGKISDTENANGTYIAVLDLVYAKGDSVSSTSSNFICVSTPPSAKVQLSPKYFSPDNDGIDDDLFVKLKCDSLLPISEWSFTVKDPQGSDAVFWKKTGTSAISERIIWDGKSNSGELVQSATDYPYEFTVTDTVGLVTKVTGFIPVDVLVIRTGDVLKIQIPSIIFRANKADFIGKDKDPVHGLSKETIANNERVLKRIAEILNKFRDYNVIIEGHANNVTGTESEEVNELVPLSKERADFVRTRISRYGVNPARMTSYGKGGREPVAPTNDKSINWKNRRVEFILVK